jgi:hypothetical protein
MIIARTAALLVSVVAASVILIAAAIFMVRGWQGRFTCIQNAIRFLIVDWLQETGFYEQNEDEERRLWSNFMSAVYA